MAKSCCGVCFPGPVVGVAVVLAASVAAAAVVVEAGLDVVPVGFYPCVRRWSQVSYR